MKLIVLVLSLIVVFFQASFAQPGVDYSRSSRYGALKLSVDEFKQVVSQINYYYKESLKDTAYHNKSYTIFCTISGNNGKSISISTFEQIDKLKIDDNYTQVIMEYRSPYAPLSLVKINLANFDRSMSVTGQDEKKVNALYQEINSRLESKIIFFSWLDWSLLFRTFLFSSFIIGMFVLSQLLDKIKRKETSHTIRVITIVLAIYLIIVVIYNFLPITADDLFPKFLLTPYSVNWWVRNSSLIGFLSFIFTIITALYKVATWIMRKLSAGKK